MNGLQKQSSKKSSALVPALAAGGGLGLVLLFIGWWRNAKVVAQVTSAVQSGGTVKIRTTGYWPFQAGLGAAARKMEGGVNDRKGRPLRTAEDFFSGKADFASLSGDPALWPYGQKLLIPWVDGRVLVGRVVDTGSHFAGATKVYRVLGAEPIDVCVAASSTLVPKLVDATVVFGDHLDKPGKEVATSRIGKPTVAGIVDGYTTDDYHALSRMVASERPAAPAVEKCAVAWSARNRAEVLGVSIHDLLAPEGKYGPQGSVGGRDFASTRRAPTTESDAVVEEVLAASASADPTFGAIDFWVPSLQDKMRGLGDVGRIAAARGDEKRAQKYSRWADYMNGEDDVRAAHAAHGLKVVAVIGDVELLALRRAS